MNNLNSNQLERHFLGGLIQNQYIFPEIAEFLTEKAFCSKVHDVIYSCIKTSLLNNEKVDKVLIAQKIKNLGISFKDDINIFNYIEDISYLPITAHSTIESAKELVKLNALREVDATCDQIQAHIKKAVNQPLEQTIGEIDALYGRKIDSFSSVEDGEENMFDGLLELAEERRNNPVEEVGLATPYPEFNRLYGGLRNKNLYFIIARAKAGKSTFLNDLCSEISSIHDADVLYLDTEMSTEETKFRAISAKTGVPMWFVESGQWGRNPDFNNKIRNGLKDIGQKYKVTHRFVGNKSIEQIGSICRRWRMKKGRNKKALICYDYVKIPDEGSNRQEHQLMGDRVDFLKQLGVELDLPVITAGQSNRAGITTNKKVADLVEDESVVGISDRINWYATYVGYLRRKVAEEIVLDTPESGTHLLMELVARFQGKDAAGHQDLIKRTYPNGQSKYVKNYINLEFNNFCVTEKGSLKHSIERQNAQHLLVDPHHKQGHDHHQQPL